MLVLWLAAVAGLLRGGRRAPELVAGRAPPYIYVYMPLLRLR